MGAFYYFYSMVKGKRKVPLLVDTILDKITPYDIFRYYMPSRNWKLNAVTNSPFRKDRNPSFLISNRSGHLSFIDFGNINYRGDCFDFVQKMFNIPKMEDVLKKIDCDFGLGISTSEVKDYKAIVGQYKQPTEVKRISFIQVVTRKFTEAELKYWSDYHQSLDDLKKNNVYAIKKVFLNRQLHPMAEREMVFGYFYDGHWKIYRPFADKKSKWVPNNVPISAMDGEIKECDTLFITKSKKDFLVLSKIIPCVCAVQNESTGCFTLENVERIKTNSKRQILGFDSDVTGVSSSQQITKLFDFGYCNVPRKLLSEGIKDFADWAKNYGLDTVKDYLEKKGVI